MYTDYKTALTDAILAARKYRREMGIERCRDGYNVFILPKKENRSGYELRCEVVRDLDPLPAQGGSWVS